MKSSRSRLFTVAIVVLVTQLAVTEVDKNVKSDMISQMGNDELISPIIRRTLYTLENSPLLKNEKVEKYINIIAGGFLFDVIISGKKYVARVIVDSDAEYKKCRHEKAYEDLKSKGISYVDVLEKYDEYKGSDSFTNFYSCVLIPKKEEYDLQNGGFFTKMEAKDKEENSRRLFRFFGKVIQSFAELNFKAKTLHGDIRPDTIQVKLAKISENDFELVPVITEFGLRLENTSGEEISSMPLRYSRNFRAPEMAEKTAIEKVDSEEKCWYTNWQQYKFSKEFVEDVYALGKTISQVLYLQEKYLNGLQCEMQALRSIYDEASKQKERVSSANGGKIIKMRPNMKEVLAQFLKKMEECDPGQTIALNKELFSQIEQSLASLNSSNLLIQLISFL